MSTAAVESQPHSQSQSLSRSDSEESFPSTEELSQKIEDIVQQVHPGPPLNIARDDFLRFNPNQLNLQGKRVTYLKPGTTLTSAQKMEKQTICAFSKGEEEKRTKTQKDLKVDFEKPLSEALFSTENVGIHHTQGHRPNDEDCYFSLPISLLIGEELITAQFHGVCDGHGDEKRAAQYVSHYLPIRLNEHLSQATELSEEAITHALTLAITELDTAIDGLQPIARVHNRPNSGGTTLVAALEINGVIYLPNVGDSRAILVKSDTVYQLTEDAKPEDVRFVRGVRRIGQDILFNGLSNSWRVAGSLAVARDIGLSIVPTEPKISCIRQGEEKDEPDKGKIFFQEGDHLILACDGLWDVATNEDVATNVRILNFQKNCMPGEIAARLTDGALHSGSTDNISVIVLKL